MAFELALMLLTGVPVLLARRYLPQWQRAVEIATLLIANAWVFLAAVLLDWPYFKIAVIYLAEGLVIGIFTFLDLFTIKNYINPILVEHPLYPRNVVRASAIEFIGKFLLVLAIDYVYLVGAADVSTLPPGYRVRHDPEILGPIWIFAIFHWFMLR